MFASFSCSSSNPVCLSIRSTGKSLLMLCSTNSFTPQVLVPSAWRLALHIGHSCLWSWKDGQQVETIFQHDCPPHQISLNAASAKRVSTWGCHRVPKQTKAEWTVEVSFLKGEKLVHIKVEFSKNICKSFRSSKWSSHWLSKTMGSQRTAQEWNDNDFPSEETETQRTEWKQGKSPK